MRARRWISVLAALGVLLHAGAIVRHNAIMTGAALQYQALLIGLTQHCHGGAAGGALVSGDLPYLPRPSDADHGCPICSGLAQAVALIGPEPVVDFRQVPAAIVQAGETSGRLGLGHAVCPPARGPPAVA